MAQLIVRNLDQQLVVELKQRAVTNGRSAEEEHRQILRDSLQPRRPGISLKDLIADIPNVGDDSDFERVDDFGREQDL